MAVVVERLSNVRTTQLPHLCPEIRGSCVVRIQDPLSETRGGNVTSNALRAVRRKIMREQGMTEELQKGG